MHTVQPTRLFTNERMQTRRAEGDPLADRVVTQVVEESGMAGLGALMTFLGKHKPQILNQTKDNPVVNPMLLSADKRIKAAIAPYALALDELPGPDLPTVVQTFFTENNQLPAWANQKRITAGVTFFQKYQEHLLLLLGVYSLPYCYAAADGAQVLYISQRLQKNTYQRLAETGQFVLSVAHPNAFAPGGAGPVICKKVRLMHAAVRYYSTHSGKWNAAWGLPVNQEDMAGTNLAMSYIPIRGLRKIGIHPAEKEAEDYLHLWNVVGYFLGIEEELLPLNLREAYHLDRVIAQRNFRPSEAGKALTKALLDSLESNADFPLPKHLPANQMRQLLGDTIADLLDIPAANWTQNLLQTARLKNFFHYLQIA